MGYDGIINVYKQPGPTSHDVVRQMRRLTGERRVGHTGTLDPAAAGVLPVCVGRATRAAEYVLQMDKSYRAELTLGVATDTEDASGQVIAVKEIPPLDEQAVTAVLSQFTGTISQVPPMYSAVRSKGQRLYRLARRGEEVVREARLVNIHSLQLLSIYSDRISLEVTCSRGTYVRTLCVAIAEKLGTCGHMSSLLRTAVGPYVLAKAYLIEELAQLAEAGCLEEAILPVDMALQHLPPLILKSDDAAMLINGRPVPAEVLPENSLYRLYHESGRFLAVARYSENRLHPEKVFWTADQMKVRT